VATIFITIQAGYIGDNLRSQRIQMDVTNQFPEIDVFLADYGFISVLKKLPVPLVSSIEIDHVPCQKPSH
jgi:hypothetical protein